MRFSTTVLIVLLDIVSPVALAAELHCPLGDPVAADLGDGVIMHTCMWQNEAQQTVRVGPLELTKNDILILKTQTNTNGQLHGQFTSWDDTGLIITNGVYVNGQKDGGWLETDKKGNSESLHYQNGKLVSP